MDNSSGLLNPLASPALLVMASSSEAPRGPSPPCPQPHPFGVPLNLDKPAQVPFLGTGYSLMYSPPEHPGREYPSPLLPLTFGPPSLEQAAVGMLGYGALYPFTPFPLPEELGSFLGAKQLKSRYLVLEKDLKDQRDHGEREPGPGLASLSLRPFQASSGPRPSQSKKGDKKLDGFPWRCPLCQHELLGRHLEAHLQYEMEGLTRLLDREAEPASGEDAPGLSQASPGAEDGRPASPYGAQPIYGGGHKEDRQQTFLQVKSNREARLGARVSRCKRIRSSLDEQLECPLPRGSRAGEAEDELSEGSRCGDDEYQALGKSFLGMKAGRLQATPCSSSSRDSDGDLDSEGEDDPPKYPLCPPAPKDPLGREEGAGGKADDQAPLSSLEILQARVQELTHRLLRTGAYKCHICLDSYSMPLASIQCWHIHCELCWLRTLGSKKLCPQCNTITSPADLRRVYL